MFSKSKDEIDLKQKKSIPSIISSGLVIKGDLVCDGEIQIDGKVEGDITCTTIIIGITGMVKGVVAASNAKIYGELCGKVSSKTVMLGSSAKVIGDVTHESLAIEPGAYIEGHCMRIDNKKESFKDIKIEIKQDKKEDKEK
ncbi:MAG: Polymer-forming cytoskeletal [Alphaproteobacteria bacterium ADurb.Bin438]|nr:MAG: Polymer-forming cytoskeletal [Alphaproteobacteria bacterium ADurb.Bin438]